ncbi:hypothetical protein VPNG_07634 [Cytospora leucostoma]|uniref:Uncharacterized protein n=1 Tax=Cytospora leucostoma TaxID=1230097 RepID=A0A423WEZ5_9PEZI|nr:hypothetical protein VPNG_07634 [Cytospora leucostoma]
MDSQAFLQIITSLFTAIIVEYVSKWYAPFPDLLYLIRLELMNFASTRYIAAWETRDLQDFLDRKFRELDASISIIERIQKTLEWVFGSLAQLLEIDNHAARQVLPGWKAHFERILNHEIRQLLPNHAPQFDIMRFMGPAMDSSTFIRTMNNHINAYSQLHEPENVALPGRQPKLVLKPNRPANAQPTPPGCKKDDPNFYHRCMFCTAKDTCVRDDDAQDHMRKVHNYYDGRQGPQVQERDFGRLTRKHISVLRAIVVKERAVYNSLVSRYLDTGIEVGNLPGPRDAQGGDLGSLTRNQLAELLQHERASSDAMGLDDKIGRIYEAAWELHWACSTFDWHGAPPA